MILEMKNSNCHGNQSTHESFAQLLGLSDWQSLREEKCRNGLKEENQQVSKGNIQHKTKIWGKSSQIMQRLKFQAVEPSEQTDQKKKETL